MAIYIKESDIPATSTRKNLIRYFFRGKVIPTYFDKECTQLQCDGKGESGKGSSRSITELHEIIKSRFPITSLKAVVKIIYQLIDEDHSIILVWCKKINKVVVQYNDNASSNWISSYSKKNYFTTKGEDGYSLEDFEKIKETL